jgi:RecA/RadA recombinase
VKEFCKKANKELKGDGKIVTGADLDDLKYIRQTTGVPGLDWLLNGGLIQAAAAQFWGRFRNGKTYTLYRIMANFQKRGIPCMLGSIERFDRAWARQVGVFIEFTPKEMGIMGTRKRKNAERYNQHYHDNEVPPLSLALHHDSVRVLDLVVEATRANVFGLIGVDSLGEVIDSSHVEEKSVGDKTYGGQADIFTSMVKQMSNALRRCYDDDNVMTSMGERRNETCVVYLNQARATIGSQARSEHKLFHPTGGEALKHFWEQEVFFKGGEEFAGAYQYNGKKKRDVFARMIEMTGTKMKGSPEQRTADMWMSLKAHEDEHGRVWRPGQADDALTLRALATQLDVVTGRGNGLCYRDHKFKGKIALEKSLAVPKLYDRMYADMLAAAHKQSLEGEVPEVWKYQ